MAICFRRIFKSSGSVLFLTRRNHQTNNLGLKTNLKTSFLREVSEMGYSPLSESCACNLGFNSMFCSTNEFRNNTPGSCDLEKIKFDCSNNLTLDCFRNKKVLLCAKQCNAFREDQKDLSNPGKPEPEQVLHIFNILGDDLPKLFKEPMNYKIYHPHLVFENNIKGTTTIGVFGYIKQIALLRAIGRIKFARIRLDILKITAHPEDGTVRVRWRIRGIPSYKALISYIKHFSFFITHELEGWYDGFSVFYVRSDGLIHKHTVDKMIPDSNEKFLTIQNGLAAKIALALGIMMKDLSPSCSMLNEGILSKNEIPDVLFLLKDYDSSLKEYAEFCTLKASKVIK